MQATTGQYAVYQYCTNCLQQYFMLDLAPGLHKIQPPDQAGSRPNHRCDDHLMVYRVLEQRCREWGVPLYISTMDFTKAFDRIKHSAILNSLQFSTDRTIWKKKKPLGKTQTIQKIKILKWKIPFWKKLVRKTFKTKTVEKRNSFENVSVKKKKLRRSRFERKNPLKKTCEKRKPFSQKKQKKLEKTLQKNIRKRHKKLFLPLSSFSLLPHKKKAKPLKNIGKTFDNMSGEKNWKEKKILLDSSDKKAIFKKTVEKMKNTRKKKNPWKRKKPFKKTFKFFWNTC